MTYERSYTHDYGTTVIESAASYIADCKRAQRVSFQVNAVVDSTAKVVASSSITTSGVFTSTAHGYYTGLKGQFTTSGALPTGLATSTNYYIIVIDANTFTVASSLANALAVPAVPVTITDAGTGNQTFTPVSVSGCSYKLQWSNDYIPNPAPGGTAINSGNWIDAASGETDSVVTNTISSTANTAVSGKSSYAYCRILFAISAGSVQIGVIGHN